MKWLITLMLMLAMTASAADITGTWKGKAETANGTLERTFVFKQDGTKLTGETTSDFLGKSTIVDGKVDGDNVAFSIKAKFEDNEITLNYTGKIVGDEIKLKVEIPTGDVIEYVAKKTS